MQSNELTHHGVKGQKWGVRRYQNKDGSLTVYGKLRSKRLNDTDDSDRFKDRDNLRIKKGTTFYRISTNETDENNIRYASYRKNDRNFYKGYWGNILREKNSDVSLYEHEYQTIHDLIIPSTKKRKQMLLEVFEDDEVFTKIYDDYNEIFDGKLTKQRFKEAVDKWDDNKRLDIVTSFMSHDTNILAKYGQKVINEGFNATIDDNGHSVGEMPIIFLTANKDIVQRGSKVVDSAVEAISRSRYDESAAKRYRDKISTLIPTN